MTGERRTRRTPDRGWGRRTSGVAISARTGALVALLLPAAVGGAPAPRRCPGPSAPDAVVSQAVVAQAVVVSSGAATFRASSRLGDFAGTTTTVTGEVTGESPEAARGWVDVTLDSLRTGNGRRDRHMREALETARHPRARFALDSLRRASGEGRVVLHGRFTVRGVTRVTEARGTLSAGTAGAWRLAATFPVSLAAHGVTKGIARLGGLLSVADTIQVEVALLVDSIATGRR